MSGNLRNRDNEALDVAISFGNAHGLPVLVVFELTERYPFASDRHHRFILEGAREALAAIHARGVATAAYVQRPGARNWAVGALADTAALVVCDDVPTRPYREDRAALLQRTKGEHNGPPVLAVDAACVVPMSRVGRAYDRAFKFRQATKREREARLQDPRESVEPQSPMFDGSLPGAPVDLDKADLGAFTAACAIDHGVPPVPEFPGGETAALARWSAFRDEGLNRYADRRNDALQEGYVSHMSPYLRHGMISARRLAREAAARSGKGPAKFLDELLIWREMSWSYAFHEPEHDRYESLPAWARDSLERRTIDPRPTLYSWETLARGRTHDPFWNAAQAAYLRRGYLHNNVRMTWGKAIPLWTEGPTEAAEHLVDLNNRFSLDGGDPNSYSGLFWCLGGFDRPFEPEQPILGVVRPRSTEIHARRLDTARFATQQTRHPEGDNLTVAVIGGGLAGLICARTLQDHDTAVTVFDKGRGVGGRTATRRLGDTAQADHGAPWFDAPDARLAPYLQSWQDMGLVEAWPARLGDTGPAFVGVSKMRALAEHLATDLDIRHGVRVEALERGSGGWYLRSPEGRAGPFDRVVVAVPAPQAATLFEPVTALASAAARASYAPTITAMVQFAAPVPSDTDVHRDVGPIQLAIRDSAKPGRADSEGDTWVLHANAAWSGAQLEADANDSAAQLFAAFREHLGGAPEPVQISGHRWRYAQVATGLGTDCLFDPDKGIGGCGDWCPGGGIDGALLSGMAMAGRIFASEPAIAARARRIS